MQQMCETATLPKEPLVTDIPAIEAAISSADRNANFTRHVLLFSLANMLGLACNGVLTFLLPRMLSMESYGYYRLFLLYGSFAGLLHLGLLDGGLIRWAARPKQRIKPEILHTLGFLWIEHLTLFLPALLILIVAFHQRAWFWMLPAIAVYALVLNSSMLGQFALQAGKQFGVLSAITVVNPALLLAVVVLLNRWRQLTLPTLVGAYIFSWVVAGGVAWVVLAGKFHRSERRRPTSGRHFWRVGAYNIRMGWSVLLANTFTALIFSMDRIAVSLSFHIREFAVYSLAASALAVVNAVILSVARVVFPYLSDGLSPEKQVRAYRWGEACLIGLWAVSLGGYFPLHWLITRLLPNYIPSLPVLRLLMLGTGLTAIIHILQCNFFRSTFRLAQLLIGCTLGLISAVVLLTLARHTNKLSMMASAMLGSVALWWLFNEWLLRSVAGGNFKHLARTALVYSACAVWFAFCTSWSNLIVACCSYLFVAVILVAVCYFAVFRTVRAVHLNPFLKVRVAVSD